MPPFSRPTPSLRVAFAASILVFSAGPAAARTELHLDSEVGDFIGKGLEQTFTQDDGTFEALRTYEGGVEIRFYGEERSWSTTFVPPEGKELIPGPYEDATRHPFQSPIKPGLDVSGDGRGCNELYGRFVVLEFETGADDEVISFAADFEQHCEWTAAPALFGRVLFQSPGPPFAPPHDEDHDGIPDTTDNCPLVGNSGQADEDADGIGNKCDTEFTRTGIVLHSETGDFIGQGRTWSFGATDGLFEIWRNDDNGVSIRFLGDSPWYLDFAAPYGAPLVAGAYEAATRYPFQSPTSAGLDISGDHRGCNQLTGRFDILEVEYGDGEDVERFAASFEQHCEGWEPALTGTVSFRASGPPFPDPPDTDGDGITDARDNCPLASNADQANDDGDELGAVCDNDGYTVETIEMESESGDWVGLGRSFMLGPDDGRMSVDAEPGLRASFEFRGTDVWHFDFVAPSNGILQPGAFENAQRYPFQQSHHPGLAVSGEGRGCSTLTGRFEVLEAEYSFDFELISFAVDFQQHCEGNVPGLFGKLRYHTKPPCECADPDASGGSPMATDCRTVLLKAVGSGIACPAECCNVDSTGAISAGDALRCMKCAVGAADCNCEPD